MSSSDLQSAPVLRRLGALIYDLLIVLALLLVVGLLAQLATRGSLISVQRGQVRVPALYPLLQWFVVGAYFLWSWLRGGQTLGARAWRLRVVRDGGGVPGTRRAVWRLALAATPLLGLLLGYRYAPQVALSAVAVLWLVDFAALPFDGARRCLHDRFSGTRLVRVSR